MVRGGKGYKYTIFSGSNSQDDGEKYDKRIMYGYGKEEKSGWKDNPPLV
jgi:hypothetical protein